MIGLNYLDFVKVSHMREYYRDKSIRGIQKHYKKVTNILSKLRLLMLLLYLD